MNGPTLYKGDIFSFCSSRNDYLWLENGALLVADGKVIRTGDYTTLREQYPEVQVVDYTGRTLMPGLIDSHLHFPQCAMIGMFGKQLMDWLNDYTFPTEAAYADPDYAQQQAHYFIRQLLPNGTTAAMSYGSVHQASAEALLQAAKDCGIWMLAGKVWMDRNAPDYLLDTPQTAYDQSEDLIRKWHRDGRLRYVITPRFAITSSPEQLEAAGALHQRYPDTYIQTHLSENHNEIQSVASLFPERKDYLEVYEHFGLVNNRSFMGHCIHLDRQQYTRMAERGATSVHCPTSNLFLGSGLYDLERADEAGVKTVLGTDVAAGTSFSLWKTMGAAYQIQQLRNHAVSPLDLLYRCTLGAAQALGLDAWIGSLKPGKDADFIVMNPESTPEMAERTHLLKSTDKWTLENRIFGYQMLGDDRHVEHVYLNGKKIL